MTAIPVVDFEPGQLDDGEDPYARFDELRAAGPVVRTRAGFVCVTGYQAALDLLRHPDATSGPIALRYLDALPPGAARDELSHRINFLDPPDHPRVRRLVSKAFTPKRVSELRPFVETTTAEILDQLGGAGSFDLLHDFAHQVPSLVISEMLGVPPADRDQLTALSDAVMPLLGVQVDPEQKRRAIEAAEDMHAHLGALLEQRRAAPGDDLLSALLAAEEDGERLDRVELLSLAATLYSAGHRTTRDLTTNGLSVLLARPELVDRVREGAVTVPEVVQEFLRFETPTLYVARVPGAPLELAGYELQTADPVLVLLGSANRDEAVFAGSDEFRPERYRGLPETDEAAPLSFAFGPHYCLGASLARMEAEVMVSSLLDRFATVEVVSEPLTWRQRGPFRSLTELVVRAEPQPR